jgi:hypothetical protein
MGAGTTCQNFSGYHAGWLAAPCAGQSAHPFGHFETRIGAIRASAVKTPNKVERRPPNRGHSGWISVSAHVCLYECSAEQADGVPDRRLQSRSLRDILFKHQVRRRRFAPAPHDNEAVFRKFRAPREGHCLLHAPRRRVSEIRLQACVVAGQFQSGFAIDEENEFAPDRHKGNMRMRAETPLVRKADALRRRRMKNCGVLARAAPS